MLMSGIVLRIWRQIHFKNRIWIYQRSELQSIWSWRLEYCQSTTALHHWSSETEQPKNIKINFNVHYFKNSTQTTWYGNWFLAARWPPIMRLISDLPPKRGFTSQETFNKTVKVTIKASWTFKFAISNRLTDF